VAPFALVGGQANIEESSQPAGEPAGDIVVHITASDHVLEEDTTNPAGLLGPR
jgi:hypothetical protein